MKKTSRNYELNFLRNAEIVEIADGFAVYSVVADKEILVTHFLTRNDALQAMRLTTKALKAIDKGDAYYE